MKKHLSLLLVLCMLITSVTPAFATETGNIAESSVTEEIVIEETAVEESVSEEQTEEPILEEEIEEIEETEKKETEVSEDETYMLNIVLFALSESASIESIEGKLEDLGISQIKPLFTDEDGNAKPIGKKNEVWYRAYTSEDVYETVDALNNIKGVTYSEPEYIYTSDSHGLPKDFDASRDWPIKKHLQPHKNGKDWFWWYEEYGHTFAPGSGTIVAVIDTGVDYTHEDLASNMWVNTAEMYGTEGVDDDLNGYIDDIYGVDTTATGKKAGNPMDDNGHGTHVAGIIGMSANGDGGIGLAYGTKIMAVKAGQSTGTLASSHIAKAINYAHMMGADVINMSFGGTSQSYLVETALEDAFSDCVLVASAGNDGIPTTDAPKDLYPIRADIYPAGYSYVLGVMATDKNGNLASFSNWDYTPNENCEYELTAPGKDIYSTLPGNRYAKWSGTSMAAPFVAATAAIIRSHYDDKDMYSSRFIMGQIVSATTEKTGSYPALSVYDSIYYLPKPNITVKDKFLMDNVTEGTVNDGDSIIDAGEVIDLGVLIRNRWGQTGEITVKADAISDMGVENPWIEFITDEIALQPAGTFQEVNNGFIYDDSLLTGVENPIQFKVSSETPNDTQIKINITITTTNGVDKDDDTIYEIIDEYIFRVQAGRGISGTLTEDTTLTKDYLWIIENSLYIPEGITLTIEPGTRVQFYSADFEDAYGGLTIASINCKGTLNAIGTEDEPIEMYPGVGFENYCVEIAGIGKEILQYCNISNPRLGRTEIGNINIVRDSIYKIDHCVFNYNSGKLMCRYVQNGQVLERNVYLHDLISISEISNSVFRDLTSQSVTELQTIQTNSIRNCLFESCEITLVGMPFAMSRGLVFNENNVFNNTGENKGAKLGGWYSYAYLGNNFVSIYNNKTYTYNGAKSKYILVKANDLEKDIYLTYNYYDSLAKFLNGALMSINDNEEEKFLNELYKDTHTDIYIGVKFNEGKWDFEWADGTDYHIDVSSGACGRGTVCFLNGKYQDIADMKRGYMAIELPLEKSDDEIFEQILKFNYEKFLIDLSSPFKNNAIINPLLNNNSNLWISLVSTGYSANKMPNYAYNNYWGTENKTLINKMITDADDYAGQYQDIIEDPILTLESESLSDIYPFVTKVYLKDSDGNIVSNVQPGETYNVHVHFNRDMDMDTQPSVSYGGAEPYTDYMVDGDFVSPREWVGTTRISPVLTSGTMYWRTKGGCAADDKWLVCGEDILRFSFNISTNGVLAMLLNAEGGANKVDLSWAQNDYETLAGYNIYRSTSETSGFKKINLSILTGTEYTDTDVEPGVTYYYYFKVVNTDGNEEGNVSNTASAAPIDNIFPVLKHSPVTSAKAGSQVTISATATDNISVKAVKLYYKTGNGTYKEKTMTEGATANLYVATIPANAVTKDGVSYYVTAQDADGNVSYSGTSAIPNVINVNADSYITGITPSKVAISGGKTVTILGGNFTSDMVVKLGGETISDVSFVDGGQINFVAPAKASGSYAITLTTTDGKVITSPAPLSYTDASSMAQIPTTMTMVSGVPYTIPLYLSASGDIFSLHAEIDLPTADFTSVTVEKADATANFTLDHLYSNGVLKIGCIGTSNINTGDGAIVNIIVTPKVTEEKQYDITLHDVFFNDVEVATVISGRAQLMPSYLINALVKYFKGTNNFVDGVTISAAGVNGITDTNGAASLTVANKTVTITADRTAPKYSITAFDASLVLQSAIGKITLDDNQKLAADVDGNGKVSEYDAALILQKAVKKIDAFPIGKAWIFTPSFIDKTLTTSGNSVSFTAISVGDVDGSYAGDEE